MLAITSGSTGVEAIVSEDDKLSLEAVPEDVGVTAFTCTVVSEIDARFVDVSELDGATVMESVGG
jgi:hypothetical protein